MARLARQLEQQAPALLAELLGETSPKLVQSQQKEGAPEIVLQVGPRTFALQCRSSGDVGPISMAIRKLVDTSDVRPKDAIPVIAVPYMGPVGKELCQQAGVNWLDLSGNASLVAPGLRVMVEGKPNLFKRRGRPANVFAPKSSRVARHLLLDPSQPFLQRELAAHTGLAETYVSRVVRRLEEDRFLLRDGRGAVCPRNPDLLLDAWRERYDFHKHDVLKGHVYAHSSPELIIELTGILETQGIGYAATALPAAWLRNQFARYRITTLYLEEYPSKDILSALHFEEGSRGANVWLVVPNDKGVFHGAEILSDGIRCVSAVQTYLDLLHHPERAKEAAERLRETCLQWKAP